MAELQQIKRERAVDSIFAALRRAILDQDFVPGERLDIHLLAKKLDVQFTQEEEHDPSVAITRVRQWLMQNSETPYRLQSGRMPCRDFLVVVVF